MDENDTGSRPAEGISQEEVALRRYEARLGLFKVVAGTLIVGLAGVLIPGAIDFYRARSENTQKVTEIRLSQQAAHQQYIKDFFSTAVNQDIELRIRFADYFAHLADPEQKHLWKSYLANLRELRDKNRQIINDKEKLLVDLKKQAPETVDNAEFDRINRELAWANAEIGYVPTERSTVLALPDSSPASKKLRLYRETTDLVRSLASSSTPLSDRPNDLARFWNLYRRDLIGVESREFARTMVQIGNVLTLLTKAKQGANTELKVLAEELVSISRDELAAISESLLAQQQQQVQPQQQVMPQQQQLAD